MDQATCVREHMTPLTHSIELSASLSAAANVLRHFGSACMPVVDGGVVCGLLSDRELTLVRELGHSMHDLELRDVPLHDVYATSVEAPLLHVAHAMAQQSISYALVKDGATVVGLLSWQTAMSALVECADRNASYDRERDPSEVRRLILLEHGNLRRLLRRVEETARKILSTPVPQESQLDAAYQAAHTLCVAMQTHLKLEDHVLAPALEALDAWGKVRADRLRSEHAEQTRVLHSYLDALEQLPGSGAPPSALAVLAQQLVRSLRADMDGEEATLLRADLLCDDATNAIVEAG